MYNYDFSEARKLHVSSYTHYTVQAY